MWLKYAARKPENKIIPSTAIKTFILPSIICLRLWCGVFPRLP
ncbi:hypothetical protein AD16_3801 [Escherichia coli 3-267-03_S4_C2]|nr:hypothetical protein HMPREF9349_03839 [Escherichia coli MS 79-10]ESD49607.1 hypothetical protein HMPREF1602_00287 [Escherichia coli 907889]ESE06480.1 hypothetical protein HMPREF1616_02099 [Escherichia coli 908658]KDU23557.1 hypothetical protein AD16_3801 [Escherichia coli 3-267-03_S4_C2]KEL83092.1 hypothetical protein AC22_3915 [Escherichia coli 5-366-08_S3_C2]